MRFRGSKPFSLAWRATILVLLYGVVAAGGALYLISRQERRAAHEQLAERLNFDLAVRTADLDHYVGAMKRTAHLLSETPPVQGMIRAAKYGGTDPTDSSSYETWRGRLETIFTAALENHPSWFQARYLRAEDGQELVRVERRGGGVVTVREPNLQSKSHRDYVRALPGLGQRETYVSMIDLNREWGEVQKPHVRTLRVGVPVFESGGGLQGLILLNADVGGLLDALDENLEANAVVYLLNANGDILVHPDPDVTFGFDLGKSYGWHQVSTSTLPAEGTRNQPGGLQNALISGDEHLIASRELRLDPGSRDSLLTLVIAVPQVALDRRVAMTRARVLSGVAIVALPVVCLMLLQLHRTLSPIRHLAISVRKIGEGHLEEPLPETAPGEVRNLVAAFRGMVEALGRRQREILKLNDELRHSENAASLIVETAPNAIVVVDAAGRIERVNQQLEATFGYQREELIGEHLEMLLPEKHRQGHRKLRREYVAAPVAREMGKGRDLFGRHRDGTEIPIEIGLAPLEADGKLRVIATITDIGVRKAALEEVRRLNAELEERVRERTAALEESNQELESFAYSVSHDLRAPLRAINGFSRILEEDYAHSLDKEGLRLLGVVRDNTQRMAQLIDDLLAFSQVGRRQMEKVTVDMGQLAQACFDQIRLGYENGMHASLQLGELPAATGDPVLLRQVWINLLDNALKYSPEGEPKVEVSGHERDGKVFFEVADQGVGFDMRFADKLFGVFQRLHSAAEIEGTGVGLALVHRIVTRHGGDVWASGEVGKGARFGFWLPVHREHSQRRESAQAVEKNSDGDCP